MKKILYFLPAIIITACVIWILVLLDESLIAWWEMIPFIAMLIASGVLLCQNRFWGGLVGMLPAIFLISFGSNTYTGLEMPIGVTLVVYYAACSFVVYKQKISNS